MTIVKTTLEDAKDWFFEVKHEVAKNHVYEHGQHAYSGNLVTGCASCGYEPVFCGCAFCPLPYT